MRLFFLLISILFLTCCITQKEEFSISYEKYTLPNGLDVILHRDNSDPIVAVATLVHVGSSREKPGKTGFAHFFEHMSFNDSENVPRGANRKMIPELGGSRNGGTWSDGTIYYEVVPKDAFEKILWIDSDRLGFMINTVTKDALEAEKQVVKNEKRQRVDNAPYGHTSGVIRANLYPREHPYNWTVIGSLPDLQAATLEDVKAFYNEFYGASNSTLVIAGDIDIAQTKELVKKWFGEIRSGNKIDAPGPMPVTLQETMSLYYEDNFAKLPELRLTYPTVENYHADSYALDVLAEILAGSKSAPLYVELVENKKWAPRVNVSQSSDELAGTFTIRVRANAGVDLDSVKAALNTGFAHFERNGFSDDELTRIKAQIETELYNNVETVLDKAFQLCIYNEFAGDPGFVSKEALYKQNVTKEDVLRVYEKYIKDKNYVMTSFVPKGQKELIVDGASLADVFEEKIEENVASEQVTRGEAGDYEKTPTEYDRSEPPLADAPLFKTPAIWTDKSSKGITVLGIESKEIPLVTFDITLKGGHWLDPVEKAGVASLLTDLMMEGTANKTPKELEQQIGLLGATITFNAADEELRITANTLARNFETTLELVDEILFQPRWDEKEFTRLKQELQTTLKDREANATEISDIVFDKLLYGDKHILGQPVSGTLQSVKTISMQDLKDYYIKNFAPSVTSVHIVGDISSARAIQAFNNFAKDWQDKGVEFPQYELPEKSMAGKIFFVDVPDAKQSVIRVGKLVLSGADDDYNNVNFARQILGGGSSGRLFQLLRIEKGYTYGAYAVLRSGLEKIPLFAYSSVRANATLESLNLIEDLIRNYAATFSDKEMETTKNMVIKGSTRSFESLSGKINLLRNISKYHKTNDYIEKSQQELLAMSLDDFHNTIATYLDEQDMFYLIVGDAQTQLKNIARFKNKKPVQLDINGEKI